MPQQPIPMAGVVLSWAFDRSTPGFGADVDAFTAALTRLQAEKGFSAFVPLSRENGSLLEVHVLPASLEAPAGQSGPVDATELGQQVRSGRLGGDRSRVKRAATAPLPQVDLDDIEL